MNTPLPFAPLRLTIALLSLTAIGCQEGSGSALYVGTDAGFADTVADTGRTDTARPDALPPGGPLPTLVVLPDTQFYACQYRETFIAQTSWIVEQKAAQDLRMVVHTGDIVDSDDARQWKNAVDALNLLDGKIPFHTVPGNHDLWPDRHTMMNNPDVLPLSKFSKHPWFGGAYDPARSDNMYTKVDIDGRTWLFVGLEWSPRDKVVEWADQVLAVNAAMPTVLFTHAYLYEDGDRYDRSKGIQPFSPYSSYYNFTRDEGVNDGEDLWQKLVVKHSQIKLVLSGHVIPKGTAHMTRRRPDGTLVHELLANYQRCSACPCAEVHGGDGYLRLIRFDVPNQMIRVETYSPTLNQWLDDSENQFELPY